MEPDAPSNRKFPPNAIHLVRTAQTIHVSLSQMADQKASILMGATFLVFTLAVGQAHSAGGAPIALLVLGCFAFLSAVCAVLAILPAIGGKPKGTPNLLFFGSFTRLSEEDYIDRVIDTLETDESIYRTMARDIYQNGQVLQRKKYRLLGFAYRIFLFGLTISFIAFVIEIWR